MPQALQLLAVSPPWEGVLALAFREGLFSVEPMLG